MDIVFNKQAYAVYFVNKETKEIVIDSVFLSLDKAMRYAAEFNEWELKDGDGDSWFCLEVDFADEK